MVWQKEKNFKFKLLNLNETEEFTIWKAWDKRSEIITDSTGNEIKFPVKTGQLMGSDNQLREISEIKFIKKDEFTRLYPSMSKSTSYTRTVLVDGNAMQYNFKISANNKLKEAIDMIQNMGQDPLQTVFEQVFDRNQSAANMYSIKICKATEEMPNQSFSGVKDSLGLTDKEKEFLAAVRSMGGTLELSNFTHTAKINGITSERAKLLFEKAYK